MAGLDLAAHERAWLTRPDPRAWRTDPYRRSRTLTALIEETPITVAVALRRGAAAADLDLFFSSRWFHDAIESRRALAPCFGEYLRSLGERLGQPLISDQARLETAVARVRRRPRDTGMVRADVTLTLAPNKALATVAAGTLAWWQVASSGLAADGLVEAVLDVTRPLPAHRPPADGAIEHLLAEVGPAGAPVLSELPEALGVLLSHAEAGSTRSALARVAAGFGADAAEAAEILDDLVAEGLLADYSASSTICA